MDSNELKNKVKKHKKTILFCGMSIISIIGGSVLSYICCKKAYNSGYNLGYKHGSTTMAMISDLKPETVDQILKEEAEITHVVIRPVTNLKK